MVSFYATAYAKLQCIWFYILNDKRFLFHLSMFLQEWPFSFSSSLTLRWKSQRRSWRSLKSLDGWTNNKQTKNLDGWTNNKQTNKDGWTKSLVNNNKQWNRTPTVELKQPKKENEQKISKKCPRFGRLQFWHSMFLCFSLASLLE